MPPVGIAIQQQFLDLASVLGLPSATAGNGPTYSWWSVVPGWILMVVGLVGLSHDEDRERHRQRLIEDADQRATAHVIEDLRRAA
jgi:hypothetical protein